MITAQPTPQQRTSRPGGRLLAALALAAWLAGCAVAPRSQLEAYPPVANDQPPGASPAAQQLAKALGRGVSLGNMLEAPREGAWGLSVTEELLDVTRGAGFATVRLPVRWSSHAQAERPFRIDPAFMARVVAVVQALQQRGLRVILNQHHYRQLDGDPLDEGDPAQHAGLADERFLALWQQVAERFAAVPNDALLFELYNEPHGRLDAARWNDLMARAVGVVRRSNPARTLLVGPTAWNNVTELERLRLPNDANLIVVFHHYEPFAFTHQGAFWIQPPLPTGVNCCDAAQTHTIREALDQAKAWGARQRYPVLLGEFGSYKAADLPSRERYTRQVRQEAEQRGINWVYWELAAHFGVYDPASRRLRQGLLDALMGTATP